ncbi:hypothetical protein MMC26_005684 [Xylographa opegraphella]|nr:hypothetical protein [Xylographa opegraphella]
MNSPFDHEPGKYRYMIPNWAYKCSLQARLGKVELARDTQNRATARQESVCFSFTGTTKTVLRKHHRSRPSQLPTTRTYFSTASPQYIARVHHRRLCPTIKMGNGAKAASKRERNAKEANTGGKSQLKSNAAAKTLICKNCKQDWQGTTNKATLEQHASSRHPKLKYEDCFDN